MSQLQAHLISRAIEAHVRMLGIPCDIKLVMHRFPGSVWSTMSIPVWEGSRRGGLSVGSQTLFLVNEHFAMNLNADEISYGVLFCLDSHNNTYDVLKFTKIVVPIAIMSVGIGIFSLSRMGINSSHNPIITTIAYFVVFVMFLLAGRSLETMTCESAREAGKHSATGIPKSFFSKMYRHLPKWSPAKRWAQRLENCA